MGNLHICRHKTVPKHHVLQCFQIPCLPKRVFFNFSMFQCLWQTQTYIVYKKSFQNIVFHTVFPMFPVKNTLIYRFFAIKSVQNTSFCSVFNALASKTLSKYRYRHCFFTFRRFFHCRKATKMTQNSISIPS